MRCAGTAVGSLAERDRWVGWHRCTRETHLGRVLNNAPFLLLPWVLVKNRASQTLSFAPRRVVEDLTARYCGRLGLLQTLVQVQAIAASVAERGFSGPSAKRQAAANAIVSTLRPAAQGSTSLFVDVAPPRRPGHACHRGPPETKIDLNGRCRTVFPTKHLSRPAKKSLGSPYHRQIEVHSEVHKSDSSIEQLQLKKPERLDPALEF